MHPRRLVDEFLQEHGGRDGAAPAPAGSASTAAGYLGSGACVFDYDGDGRPDILLVNSGGAPAIYRNEGGGHFANVTKSSGIAIAGQGLGCAVGDYNNDGRPDIALSYGNGIALFENQGNGKFLNVASQVGIDTTGLVLGITFVDYDHDGDLDLYAVRFPDSPVDRSTGQMAMPPGMPLASNVMWRNDGNGKFTNVTAATGLQGSGLNVGATLSDINNDRAVDLVMTGWRGGPAIYLNPREGVFRRIQPWAPAFSAPTLGVTALDFNKDGWMDIAVTQADAPGLSLWRNVQGKQFEPVRLPRLDWNRAWGLSAFDYDNDGWVDLVAVGDHPGQVPQLTVDAGGDGGAVLTEDPGEQLPDRRRLGHTPLSLALDADQMDLDFRHVHSSGTATSRFAGHAQMVSTPAPRPDGVWQEALIGSLQLLGFSPSAARQAVVRSTREGWLEGERIGRRSRMRPLPLAPFRNWRASSGSATCSAS